MTLKVDWEDRPCPGGCGHVHRSCCDSVVLQDHQSACPWVLAWMHDRGMLDLEPAAHLEDGDATRDRL